MIINKHNENDPAVIAELCEMGFVRVDKNRERVCRSIPCPMASTDQESIQALRRMGFVRLGPGQVVAEYAGCFEPNPCPPSCEHFENMRCGKACHTKLVEVKK